MSTPAATRPTRKEWKVTVALFPNQWAALREWAELRGITGGELVSSILNTWINNNPPPPRDDEPAEALEDA